MTIQLTNKGWINGIKGTWSNSDDRVRDLRMGINLSSRFRPRTRAGDDLIDGASLLSSGLNIAGNLETAAGNDRVRGVSQTQAGILNEGTIDCGAENDKIIAWSTESRGLENQGYLYTSSGNDLIIGRSGSQEGITNSGYITMEAGNDTMRAAGITAGLRNDGYIDMGTGSDVVDVRRGGFEGTGNLYMGSGFDKVFGFGPQTIDGAGDRDSLFLNQGTFSITDNTDEWGNSYGKKITDESGTSMIVNSIESIGSAFSLQEVTLDNGTLLINAMGGVSYL
jgi:hypothetical protein